MPRVIAGTAGGRPLKVPSGRGTRPTSDRVKEALFSSLGDLSDLVVLDLYAGSGALGIETLSRGASAAVFVEQDRRAVSVIRGNLKVADVGRRAQVVTCSVSAFCDAPIGGAFDLVLSDPPYDLPLSRIEEDLASLIRVGALVEGARVVLERNKRIPEDPPAVLGHDRDRAYGDTLLRYLTHTTSHLQDQAAELSRGNPE
jgi:16S rRNA (guanine966-N2)-methyltransferase